MAELHDECYAYSAKHKYPIHTKQAALLSYQEYLNDMDSIPLDRCKLVNEAFVKAAAFHDIQYPSPIPEVVQRLTVSFTTDKGATIDMTKIASEHDVDAAYASLIHNRSHIPFKTMQKIALYAYNLGLKMELENDTMNKLLKMAGLGIGDKLEMLLQFLKRASLIMLPLDVKRLFYKLYHNMLNQDDLTIYKKASDMALLLDNVDKLYLLLSHYGKLIKAPLDVCFSSGIDDMLKQASDYLHINSTDTILSKTALLEQKDKVEQFMKEKYNYTALNDLALFNKIASLSKPVVTALINELDN